METPSELGSADPTTAQSFLLKNGATEAVNSNDIDVQNKRDNQKLMDYQEFRNVGCEMIRFVANYLENIKDRRVYSNVEPGYLAPLIPTEAPEEQESWEAIISDVERVIMPGITHWHHPQFHAYFPCGSSCASICADILSDGIGCIGFTWAASPACTELEVAMLDWLAKLLRLPEYFMSSGKGGGVIQGSCSEATLVALLAARSRCIDKYMKDHPGSSVFEAASKLVGYYSDQSHSSVERAGLISMIRFQPVRTGETHEMTGHDLLTCIEEDMKKGFVPFFCTATLGTTSSCEFDKLSEIGPICERFDIWLHIDAAYAGSSFICPEYRPLLDGIEYAMSFVFNPHKWLLVNFDCSCMWLKNTDPLMKSFSVNPIYLKHKHQDKVPDFRHWHIPLGRRFRSLKLWFVLRRLGVRGLQAYIRNHIDLAHYFAQLMQADQRFEIVNKVQMALVCFRIRNDNEKTRQLLQEIENDGRIHLIAAEFPYPEKVFFLRFAVCHHSASHSHIEYAFNVIQELTERIVSPQSPSLQNGDDHA